jgi:hypothetical protein
MQPNAGRVWGKSTIRTTRVPCARARRQSGEPSGLSYLYFESPNAYPSSQMQPRSRQVQANIGLRVPTSLVGRAHRGLRSQMYFTCTSKQRAMYDDLAPPRSGYCLSPTVVYHTVYLIFTLLRDTWVPETRVNAEFFCSCHSWAARSAGTAKRICEIVDLTEHTRATI